MSVAPTLSILIAAALLAGCAGEPKSRRAREPWRDKAEAACLRSGQVQPTAFIQPARPIGGPGACGAKRPFQMHAAMDGRVTLAPAATLACPMIPAVEGWLARDVQPMAMALLGEPVTALEVAASYGCRTRNGRRGAQMSEHAFANALDVKAFRTASGRRVSVEASWQGMPEEAIFLREVHKGACRSFRTVIGPDGDRYHRDHFHLDLAWHGKDGLDHHCE